MRVTDFVGMLNDLNSKLNSFDVDQFLNKVNNKHIDGEQIKKLVDDIYNLEEDLIMIDCEKHK